MTRTAVIYARTSPECPLSADEQITHLKNLAGHRGSTVGRVFADRVVIIRKGREKRPAEAALLDAIRAGEIQRVLIWSIDRVGRSLTDLVAFLEACRSAGVSLWLDHERIDTAASNGLSLFDVGGMMAHHQRQSRRGQILRGQAVARGNPNVRFGRPPLPEGKIEKARMLLSTGKSLRQTARLAGISPTSVGRLKTGLEPTVASN